MQSRIFEIALSAEAEAHRLLKSKAGVRFLEREWFDTGLPPSTIIEVIRTAIETAKAKSAPNPMLALPSGPQAPPSSGSAAAAVSVHEVDDDEDAVG